MKLTKVNIPSDGLVLSGLAYESEKRLGIVAVLSHGYTASKESLDLLASYLAQKGSPCLTFDARGHKLGESGGEVASVRQLVSDLQNAVQFARDYFGCARIILAGHSMGGILSIATAAAAEGTGITGVVVIAAGPNPGSGFETPVGEAMLALRSDYVSGIEPLQLLEELGYLIPSIEQLQELPTLFIAARSDVLVRSSRLQEMAERAGPLHQFKEIDGSHLEAPDKARGVVGNWISRQFYDPSTN